MSRTFTHTGRRASVGYMHHGDTEAFARGAKSGRKHALNVGPNGFVAVCGVTVATYCHDHRCEEKNPVELATVGGKVTCKACLRAKPVAVSVAKKMKFAVMLDTAQGEMRWSTETSRETAERYCENIMKNGSASLTQPAGFVTRAWVIEVCE